MGRAHRKREHCSFFPLCDRLSFVFFFFLGGGGPSPGVPSFFVFFLGGALPVILSLWKKNGKKKRILDPSLLRPYYTRCCLCWYQKRKKLPNARIFFHITLRVG